MYQTLYLYLPWPQCHSTGIACRITLVQTKFIKIVVTRCVGIGCEFGIERSPCHFGFMPWQSRKFSWCLHHRGFCITGGPSGDHGACAPRSQEFQYIASICSHRGWRNLTGSRLGERRSYASLGHTDSRNKVKKTSAFGRHSGPTSVAPASCCSLLACTVHHPWHTHEQC